MLKAICQSHGLNVKGTCMNSILLQIAVAPQQTAIVKSARALLKTLVTAPPKHATALTIKKVPKKKKPPPKSRCATGVA